MDEKNKQFKRDDEYRLLLMTPEERQLLIKDLVSRIDYGVICMIERVDDFGPRWRNEVLTGFSKQEDDEFYFEVCYGLTIDFAEKIEPYLRPLSSMTDEENEEYRKVVSESLNTSFDDSESATTMVNDWLLSKHFDVRGLIKKGLALEAPEGMYDKNKK